MRECHKQTITRFVLVFFHQIVGQIGEMFVGIVSLVEYDIRRKFGFMAIADLSFENYIE